MKIYLYLLLSLSLLGLASCDDAAVGRVDLELERTTPALNSAWPMSAGVNADVPVVYTFTIENHSPYTYKGGVIEVLVADVKHIFVDVRTDHIASGQDGSFTFSIPRDDSRGQALWQAIKTYGSPVIRITSYKV